MRCKSDDLVLKNSDMIRYLKHCDSQYRNDKLDFLETTFKASRQTLDVVQDHVATFVTSLVRDLQAVDFNKGSGKKKVKKIVTEKDLEQLIQEKGLSALYYDFDDMERPSNTRQNALFIDPREMNHTIRKIPRCMEQSIYKTSQCVSTEAKSHNQPSRLWYDLNAVPSFYVI